MKKFITGLIIVAAISTATPGMTQPVGGNPLVPDICEVSRNRKLMPYLKSMLDMPWRSPEYDALLRLYIFDALLRFCPSQFSKLYAPFEGLTAETVPLEDYPVYVLITEQKSQYD